MSLDTIFARCLCNKGRPEVETRKPDIRWSQIKVISVINIGRPLYCGYGVGRLALLSIKKIVRNSLIFLAGKTIVYVVITRAPLWSIRINFHKL